SRRDVPASALQLSIESRQAESERLAPWIGGHVEYFTVAPHLGDPRILGFERGAHRLASFTPLAITRQREHLFVALHRIDHGLAQRPIFERLVDESKDLALVDAVDRGL